MMHCNRDIWKIYNKDALHQKSRCDKEKEGLSSITLPPWWHFLQTPYIAIIGEGRERNIKALSIIVYYSWSIRCIYKSTLSNAHPWCKWIDSGAMTKDVVDLPWLHDFSSILRLNRVSLRFLFFLLFFLCEKVSDVSLFGWQSGSLVLSVYSSMATSHTQGSDGSDQQVEMWKMKKLIRSLEAARGWV